MPTTKTDYIGCAVLLHTQAGEYIQKCEVAAYDKRTYQMWLTDGIPKVLAGGDVCSILIMTEPAPREYKGLVQEANYERSLLLFRGKTKENRLTDRFKVDFAAQIIALIRQDYVYDLHTPVTARVINISRSGMRLSTVANALRTGDRIQLVAHFDDSEKRLLAIITNQIDTENNRSEYGCALVVDKK